MLVAEFVELELEGSIPGVLDLERRVHAQNLALSIERGDDSLEVLFSPRGPPQFAKFSQDLRLHDVEVLAGLASPIRADCFKVVLDRLVRPRFASVRVHAPQTRQSVANLPHCQAAQLQRRDVTTPLVDHSPIVAKSH